MRWVKLYMIPLFLLLLLCFFSVAYQLTVINEDNFDKFVELHNAKFAGDTDTVDEIRAELGLGQGRMNHGNNEARGMGHGPRQGMKGQGSFGKHQGNSNGGYFVDADNDGNCDNIGLNMGQI